MTDTPVITPADLGFGWLFWRIPEAVVAADVEAGRIALWNPSATKLFGYSAEEAMGMPLEMLMPERFRALHRAGIARFRETGRGAIIESGAPLEIAGLRKDGTELPLELTLAPIDEPRVPGRFVVALIRDISERRRAEEERHRRVLEEVGRSRAEAAIDLMDRFLTVAAHELKTPITSLRGFAQLLLRQVERGDGPDPERLRTALGAIDRQSTKLTRLVEQLLDAARIQSGRLTLDCRATELRGLVVELARTFELTWDRPVRVHGDDSIVAVCDPLRIEQVVGNLIDNALRYSPPDEPVDVSFERSDREVRMAVRDRGPGVPPHRRAAIFERIKLVDPMSHHAGGLGLGLYISREIIQQHGGRLEAQFPDEGGARFVVAFPIDPSGTRSA